MKQVWKWLAAALALMLAVTPAALAEGAARGSAEAAEAEAVEEIAETETAEEAAKEAAAGGEMRYYFFAEDGHLREYGGIRITLDELLEFDGAEEIIDGAIDEGYAIADIIYRANGVINLNLERDGEEASFSLRYDDQCVRFWQQCAGSYALAREPEIAVYPDEFVHPQAAEEEPKETVEPEEPEEPAEPAEAAESEEPAEPEESPRPGKKDKREAPEAQEAEEEPGAPAPAPGWEPVPEWGAMPGEDAEPGEAGGGRHYGIRDADEEPEDGIAEFDDPEDGEAPEGEDGDLREDADWEDDVRGDAFGKGHHRGGTGRGKHSHSDACPEGARCGGNCGGGCGGARYVYTTGASELRTGPGPKFGSLCALPEGIRVEYLGEKSQDDRGVTWYYLRWNGETGWCAAVDIQSGN